MWKVYLFVISALLCVISVSARARPSEEKNKGRIYEGKVSHEKHFEGEDHNVEYDHEAFLGKDKKTFDQLSPEESVEKLGSLVDNKIDKNKDGKVSKLELKGWIKFTSKRYIYEDVDRQWDHLKKLSESILTSQGVSSPKVDAESPISWEEYKNSTYGSTTDDPTHNEEDNYKEMINRDQTRWKHADQNKDGMLTKEEYTAFLHPEEYDYMKEVVVDETLNDIDKDKDGFVSLEEYIGDLYPESEEKENKEEPDWVKTEKEQFHNFRDKNKDGKMDREEVKDWVLPPDYDHVESETNHLMHEADEDKDGELTKDEIIKKHDLFVGSQATDFGEALMRSHDEF